MSNNSNFAQALRELTGFDGSSSNEQNSSNLAKESDRGFSANFDDADGSEKKFQSKSVPVSDTSSGSDNNNTIITKSMIITGDIKSNDNIHVEGQVFGGISTSENIMISNLIVGDIRANNALLSNARLKGDLTLSSTLNVEENSIIVGNATAENVKVAGKIKGNLDVNSSIILVEKALVVGDIVADDITTESGAKIKGAVITRHNDFDYDEEAEFDLGGDF